jgi:hypothetical protein
MMVLMRPSLVRIGKEGCHRFLIAGSVITHFAAFANSLIGLNMRACGNFLQIQRDRLGAFCAFEAQGPGGFAHKVSINR